MSSPDQLHVLNSLGNHKVPFVVQNGGNTVKWYSCGPTVYDVAHLGHARSYITFDIIRRILTDYFHYDLLYVMNITDIDDKIIDRARQQQMPSDVGADKSKPLDIDTVRRLTQKYEQEFFRDMDRLNVMRPDVLTRVSEYVDKIGKFLKRLESNGFAYRSNGSVYFDTTKFNADPKHRYPKLEPKGGSGDAPAAAAAAAATGGEHADEKRSPKDFALWKKSKPGEPSWAPEDYEPGRPGWHIECSVMATDVLGEQMDIHSGGCDLKFPHHDNEIAQSEAYYNTGKDWVNYFLHSGHLTISGCKMSKSLKNFKTIDDALNECTARQLRLAFLAHGWCETLEYSPGTMDTAKTYEKTFEEFFFKVSEIFKLEYNDKFRPYSLQKLSDSDEKLYQSLKDAREHVHRALCDNFNTRKTLDVLRDLIKEFNRLRHNGIDINLCLLRKLAKFVLKILTIFGTSFNEFDPYNCFPKADDKSAVIDPKKCVEAVAMFRCEIRDAAKPIQDKERKIELFNLCDKLRNVTLKELGIQLEDKKSSDGRPFTIKYINDKND